METGDTKKGQCGESCGTCGSCDGCGRGSHMGMCGHGHWGHVLLKIAVALIIFWCGVQFGELKAVLHEGGFASSHGYGMMGRQYDNLDAVTLYGPSAPMRCPQTVELVTPAPQAAVKNTK